MKKFFFAVLSLFLGLLLASCAGHKAKPSPAKEATPGNTGETATRALTQAEAQGRSRRISSVTYKVWADLTSEQSFRGKTTVNFQLGNPLFQQRCRLGLRSKGARTEKVSSAFTTEIFRRV
jgi:outer membrane biogenesis lipoprotein LolB